MRTGFLTRPSYRGAGFLVSVFAMLLAPYLKGQTSVTYRVGRGPAGIAFDGTNIWVANITDDTVTKLLASTGATVGTYAAGSNPIGAAFDGTNIWVVNSTSNSVTKLLASTGATVGTYPVGSSPFCVAFDGTNIWVTNNGSSSVTKLLASTGAKVGTYSVGLSPIGVAFDGTNIWVANRGAIVAGPQGPQTVTKLLASNGITVGTYPVGSDPFAVAFDGVNIWVTNDGSGTVTKLLASTGGVVGTYPVGSGPDGIAFDGTNIWVANDVGGTVTELLAATGATVSTYPVGSGPFFAEFDGTNIWVTNEMSGTVTKIRPDTSQAPSISAAGIVPIYSTASTIQQGEWVSVWGNNLASGTSTWSGNFPTSLGGTSVQINGKAAYLWLVSPGQINLQAPNDSATGTVPVVVTTATGSATSTVTLAQFAPSFLLLDSKHVAGTISRSDGSGAYGGGTYDIVGPTGTSLGFPTVAAKAGDTVALFAVGLGPTSPAVLAGQVFSGAAPATSPVNLFINDVSVTPSFAGLAEAGDYQINLIIPAGLGAGDVSLMAAVGGARTPSTVVISLQ